MKRSILLTVLVVLSMAGTAQHSIDMRLVEKALHPNQTRSLRDDIAPFRAQYYVNEAAIVNFRDVYSYDENEYYLTEIKTDIQDLGSWIPYSMTTYDYDYNLMPVEIVTQKWDDGYVKDKRSLISYIGDFDPLIHEEVFQKWENGGWVNTIKHMYSYEPEQTILVKEWNGNNFENQLLYTIENQGLVTTILLQSWNGGAWMNEEKQEITYNHNQEIQERVIMKWTSPTWTNDEKHVYEYESSYKLNKIIKSVWENGAWSSDKIKIINYNHVGFNSVYAVCEANYGDGDNLNDDIELFYNGGLSVTYKHIHEISMDYVDLTKIAEYTTSSRFTVAPNPAHDQILINGEQFMKAELYSLTGQKVLESSTSEITLNGISAGAYLLKIQNQTGKVETQKVLIR